MVEKRDGGALALAGCLLALGYVLPLFAPPPAALLLWPLPETSLSQRLFPGVPIWWVWVRLACLGGAAALIVLALRRNPAPTTEEPAIGEPADRGAASARLLRTLVLFSTLHVAAGLWAVDFPRWVQLLYLAALAVPVSVVLINQRWSHRTSAAAPVWKSPAMIAVWMIVLVWMMTRVGGGMTDPRMASMVDGLGGYQALEQTARPQFNLMRDQIFSGITAIHLVPQGAGWLHLVTGATDPILAQGSQIVWTAVAGVVVGCLAAEAIGLAVAPVAVAAYLFSPITLQTALIVGPVCIGTLYVGLCALLVLRVRRRASTAALCAFGAVAGIAATHPALAPIIGTLCLWMLWSIWCRRQQIAWEASVICALTLFAAVRPGLPDLTAVQGMWQSLTGTTQWAALEALLFGRVRPSIAEFALQAGQSGPFDVLLGALLAPFAIPRTAVRLWGDVLFEPVATVLASIALVSSILAARRSVAARALLVLLALAILPGVVSGYDRPSLSRLVALPLPMALLAAGGFRQLWGLLAPGTAIWKGAVAGATLVAVSGTALFDLVNPRILGSSALTIAIEALDGDVRCERTAVLVPAEFNGLGLQVFVEHVPDCAGNYVEVAAERGFPLDASSPIEVMFWSPGLEEERQISDHLCRVWPAARLFEITDAVGLFAAFAADVGGRWTPGVSPHRWKSAPCGGRLETEETQAEEAVARADELIASGQVEGAIEVLRRAAMPLFGQARLFDKLARLLLSDTAPTLQRREEAVYWARRSVIVSERLSRTQRRWPDSRRDP